MRKEPQDTAQLIDLLRERHRIIMRGRPDKNPGAFKAKVNRAGSTHFVVPEQVLGTLKMGFKMMQALTDPIARAIYIMFLITEVHLKKVISRLWFFHPNRRFKLIVYSGRSALLKAY